MTATTAVLMILSLVMVAWGARGLVFRSHGVFRGKATFHEGASLIKVASIAFGVVLGVMILNGSLQHMLMGVGGQVSQSASQNGGPGGQSSGTGLSLAQEMTPSNFWNTPIIGPLLKWVLTTFGVPGLGALAVIMVFYGIAALGLHAIAVFPGKPELSSKLAPWKLRIPKRPDRS